MRISPFVVLQSGAPFDIIAGSDLYGTTLCNGRPGLAAGLNKSGLIPTQYGVMDPNPSSGDRLLARNYGRGRNQLTENLRLAKTIGLGPEKKGEQRPSAGPSMGGLAPAAATGRGLGGIIGTPSTSRPL